MGLNKLNGIPIMELCKRRQVTSAMVVFVLGLYISGTNACTNCTMITSEQYANSQVSQESQIPRVPKCCPMNQMLIRDPEVTGGRCVNDTEHQNFPPKLARQVNATGMAIGLYNSALIVVGDTCKEGKYALRPDVIDEDADYIIFVNGSMYLPYRDPPKWINMDNYCLDYFDLETGRQLLPFVCYDENDFEKPVSRKRFIMYAIGLLISVPFLVCTVLVYVLIPELNDIHGKCLSFHSGCLAVAFLALASVQLAGQHFPENGCVVMAFIIQFFFVACFFWLNVMCYDTWINVRKYLYTGSTVNQERRRFFWYSIYAWSFPTFLLAVSMVMDLVPAVPSTYVKPNFGVNKCWFNSDEAALPYFYAPIGILIIVNTILFILTAKELACSLKNTREVVDFSKNPNEFVQVIDLKTRWKKYKKLFRLYLLLFTVMGINWAMEVISWAVGDDMVIWTLFDVVNALQGVFIFGIFVCQKAVRVIVINYIRQVCSKVQEGEELIHFTKTTHKKISTEYGIDNNQTV